MITPNIYLDIDGVLLANESNAAPYAEEFLIYILDNYPGSVYWLTTHCWNGTNRTKEALLPAFSKNTINRLNEIKPTEWGTSKTDAIDFSKPFLWFDDDLYAPERAKLKYHGVLDQWIDINLANDPYVLKKVVDTLKNSDISEKDLLKEINRWSPYFLKCRTCKKDNYPHYGSGFCNNCYVKSNDYKVLDFYTDGMNMAEAGTRLGISRERARQLMAKAIGVELDRYLLSGVEMTKEEFLKQTKELHNINKSKTLFRDHIVANYDQLKKELDAASLSTIGGILRILGLPKTAESFIREEYPEFLEVLERSSSRWSTKYDNCKLCGGTSNKHKIYGYCTKCYTKSKEFQEIQKRYRDSHPEETRERSKKYGIKYYSKPEARAKAAQRSRDKVNRKNFGGNREIAISTHGSKCYSCGVSREDHLSKTSHDLSVFHFDGNLKNNDISNLMPACMSCFAKFNVERLGTPTSRSKEPIK